MVLHEVQNERWVPQACFSAIQHSFDEVRVPDPDGLKILFHPFCNNPNHHDDQTFYFKKANMFIKG
jgi:hypothetical protein